MLCRKGLPGLQRGPRCIAAACSLADNGMLVATPGGPYGSRRQRKCDEKRLLLSHRTMFLRDSGECIFRNNHYILRFQGVLVEYMQLFRCIFPASNQNNCYPVNNIHAMNDHNYISRKSRVATATMSRGLTCPFRADIWVIINEPRGGRYPTGEVCRERF